MGCFSWMYADTNNRHPLLIGESAYVITPDGSNIFESCYSGYGVFEGNDIYELVVDWNRNFIKKIFTERCISFLHFSASEYAYAILKGDLEAQIFLKNHLCSENYYIKEWKRELGILLACYDTDNKSLPFPIKIARSDELSYSELPASNSDPGQGFGWC